MEVAEAFSACFRRFDHVLKRSEYADLRGKRASVNWQLFAKSLPEEFFEEVETSGNASTLIAEPPRVLMSDGFTFEPAAPKPINNVVELILGGVCQVRHNYFHGEKFFGPAEELARDIALVSDALWVLNYAAAKHPTLSAQLMGTAANPTPYGPACGEQPDALSR